MISHHARFGLIREVIELFSQKSTAWLEEKENGEPGGRTSG
ncbi:MAG: hypothetical protein ACE15F_10640 [bacterium]